MLKINTIFPLSLLHLYCINITVTYEWLVWFNMSVCEKTVILFLEKQPDNTKQQRHVSTCLWTFYLHTNRDRSLQGRVGDPADEFSSRRDIRGHIQVSGQGKCPVIVLPMAGERALIWKHRGLCVRGREEQPLRLRGRGERRIRSSESISLFVQLLPYTQCVSAKQNTDINVNS